MESVSFIKKLRTEEDKMFCGLYIIFTYWADLLYIESYV